MKRVLTPIFTVLFLVLPVSAWADCKAIVEQTVAELRAAYPEWTDPMETLARTAAASACVKASGVASTGPALTSTAVAAAGSAPVSESEDEEEADEESSSDDDEGWSPFKDIKFNKVSARPNKKPYERKREVNTVDD